MKSEKEQNYLKGIEEEMNIGYMQFLNRKPLSSNLTRVDWLDQNCQKQSCIDETRMFDFDGLFVEVTLPRGEF